MRISRTRRLVVNMGNYGEKYEFAASVTLDHGDLGWTDEDWLEHVNDIGTDDAAKEVHDKVMEVLGEALASEMKEAVELKDPDEPSFIEVARVQDDRVRRKRRKK